MISIDVRDVGRKSGVWAELFGQSSDDKLIEKATVRALNRGIDAARTNTSREIRKVYNIKHSAVLKAMRILRASKGRLFARLIVGGNRLGRRIGLIEFDARWRPGMKIGASVKVKVGGPRKNVRGAFIAAATRNNARGGGSAGMLQVWRRVGKSQYPIKTLRSLSIPQAFANKIVIEAVKKAAIEVFDKTFHQQLKYLGALDG